MQVAVNAYRWFKRYVIAAMLVDGKQKIAHFSSLCSSTSSFHHCYLCLPRSHENHLLNINQPVELYKLSLQCKKKDYDETKT